MLRDDSTSVFRWGERGGGGSRRNLSAKDLSDRGEQVAMSSTLKVEWQPSHYLNASVSREKLWPREQKFPRS